MKKINLAILLGLTLLILNSCATAITVGKDVEPYQMTTVYDKPKIDFIGYKVDTSILSTASSSKVVSGRPISVMSEFDQAKAISTTTSLRQLGNTLEVNGVATNKSDSYFGIYSLQELELYKTNNRYVTFIEIAKNKLDCFNNTEGLSTLGGMGAGSILGGFGLFAMGKSGYTEASNFYKGFGIGTIIIGGIFSLFALTPSKTRVEFEGLYNIYIYDTKTKSLIRKEVVTVNCTEEFTGSYDYDDRSKEIVREYISQNISNSLLKKYDEINKWLNNQ